MACLQSTGSQRYGHDLKNYRQQNWVSAFSLVKSRLLGHFQETEKVFYLLHELNTFIQHKKASKVIITEKPVKWYSHCLGREEKMGFQLCENNYHQKSLTLCNTSNNCNSVLYSYQIY